MAAQQLLAVHENLEDHLPPIPPPDQQRLDKLGRDARQLRRKCVLHIIKLGEIIAEAQGLFPSVGRNSLYSAWLKQNLPDVTLRTAQRYVRVAMEFAGHNAKDLEKFHISSLYVLAEENTPAKSREEALRLAKRGEPVTPSLARSLIADHTVDSNHADHQTVTNCLPSDRTVTPFGVVVIKPHDGIIDVIPALEQALAAHQKESPDETRP